MSLLLILKNNNNKNLIDHLWKKIDNKLITLKITTKKKQGGERGKWGTGGREQTFSRFLYKNTSLN